MNRQRSRTTSVLYVVFVLSSEYYGVEMRNTYRVLPMEALARVPNMPDFLKGVVNLRGTLVPVLDLRARLGLEITSQTAESRIVIVNTAGQDVGFIVDAMTGVLPVPTSSIEAANKASTRSNYLSGIAVLGSRQVLLLDLDKVFAIFNGHIPEVETNDKPTPVR
jgi:purine-binding chemotaxis protein CheW